MTADRIDTAAPIDPGSLTPGSLADGVFRGRSVSVLGFARSGIALARFLADAGAEVTVYDGRPAGELDRAIAALEDRPVRLLLGPDVDPAAALEGPLTASVPASVLQWHPDTVVCLDEAAAAALRNRPYYDDAAGGLPG